MSPRKYIPTGRPRGRPPKKHAPNTNGGTPDPDGVKGGGEYEGGNLSGETISKSLKVSPESPASGPSQSVPQSQSDVNPTPPIIPPQCATELIPPQTGNSTPGNSIPTPIESEIVQALSESDSESPENHLKRVVDRLLPAEGSRGRMRVVRAIKMTVAGGRWTEVSAETGLTLLRINVLTGHNPSFQALWRTARDAGEEVRKQRRQDVADKRAVEGWDESVWYQGVQCGTLKRFDNRLLQFLLEADDPAKYRKAADPASQVNVQVNALMAALEGCDVSSLVKPQPARDVGNRADAPPVEK